MMQHQKVVQAVAVAEDVLKDNSVDKSFMLAYNKHRIFLKAMNGKVP